MGTHPIHSSKAVGTPAFRYQSRGEDAGALTYGALYTRRYATVTQVRRTSSLSYMNSRVGLQQVRLEDRPNETPEGKQGRAKEVWERVACNTLLALIV